MRLLQAAQVMSLLGTVVLEAEASALHAQGVKLPPALNGVIAAVSSLLAAFSLVMILVDAARPLLM